MNRRYSFSLDDDSDMTVKRYEEFISGSSTSGYFDVEEFETIIEYYLRIGRTSDSSIALELGMKQHPDSNALRAKRAKIYLINGDPAKAFRMLETLAEKNDYEVILLKIEALLKMERENDALEVCELLFSMINPKGLGLAYFDVAHIYINSRKFGTAIKFLERSKRNNWDNIDLLFELTYCYEQAEDLPKAIETHLEILALDAFVSEAWFNLGQIYFSQQNYPQALEAFDYVLAIDPHDSFACVQKAHILLQMERYQDAIDGYNEYAELTYDSKLVDNYIAECYEKLENYNEAIIHYKKVLEHEPENYDALTGVAVCLLEQGEYEASMEYIRQAANIHPDYADAWVYMAEAFIGLENSDEALHAYLKALELDPNQPETLIAVGNLYLEKLDYLSALVYYNTAYEQNKELEHINLFLSIAHFKLEHVELALSFLQEAIDADENAVSIFLELCPEAADLYKTE